MSRAESSCIQQAQLNKVPSVYLFNPRTDTGPVSEAVCLKNNAQNISRVDKDVFSDY